ncbi:MAG: SpoIIE family protein phosphatase [Peptoanaerobacter stomatis]
MSNLDKTLSTMVEISKIVTSSKDFFDIKDLVIDKMLEIIPPKRACVNIFRQDTYEYTYLVCKETLGDIPKYINGEETAIGKKITMEEFPQYIYDAVVNKKTCYIEDLFEDERGESERDFAELNGYVSRIAVPLISGDKARGFMTCFLGPEEKLLQDDIKFMESVASLLALSVDITSRNREIDEIVRKLRDAIVSIETLTDNLYENKGLDSYFKLIARDICKITNSKSAMIFIDDEDSDLRIIQSHGNRKRLAITTNFLKYNPNDKKKTFTFEDIPPNVSKYGISTIAYENIIKDDRKIGQIVMINSEKYRTDDLRILGIYAAQVLLSVHLFTSNRKLLEDSIIHRDLQLVHQQQKLIMEDEIMSEDDFLNIDYLNVPYKYIGGDFCKFIKVEQDKYILFIADVMGHGIMSNYFVAMTKGAINLLLTMTSSPSTILAQLNNILFKELDKMDVFITSKMIFFDFKNNKAYASNAGHTVPIAVYKDETGKRNYRLMNGSTSIALGIFENTVYEEEVFDISDIELFAVYTDGIIESKNEQGQEYGADNLAKYIIKKLDEGEEKPCQDLLSEIEDFTNKKKLEDDITIFTIRKK